MAKDDKSTEHDTAAMQVAMNEVLDALRPHNTEAQIRVIASVAKFLGIDGSVARRLM